jgi:hypothetical protein
VQLGNFSQQKEVPIGLGRNLQIVAASGGTLILHRAYTASR